MNMPENIRKWVEALRSGNYKQVTGTIKSPKGYCCLGVYYEVNYGLIEVQPESDGDENYRGIYDKTEEGLDNWFVYDKGAVMNDHGKSFAEIADMIEEAYSD